MRQQLKYLTTAALLFCGSLASLGAHAATTAYVGSDFDIGGTFFPGGTAPFVVVPWRSSTTPKAFDVDGNNVYGSAGYALFATQSTYPNGATCCGGAQPFASATYPNLISLPAFVTGSQNLVNNKVGGWPYGLIDDPTQVNGFRDFTWGQSQVPPRPGPDQSAYIKMGILDGTDIFGNNPQTATNGAGRWGFTVGAGVPASFRVGVLTDGLDGSQFAATEVILAQVDGTTILNTVASGTLTRNRFLDIHSFDVSGAQPGEQFAIFARAADGGGAISGVTFDFVPEPTATVLAAIAGIGALARRRRGCVACSRA